MNVFERVASMIRDHWSRSWRLAEVYDNNFDTGLIRVEYEGVQDTAGYRYLASYTPNDGDVVLMVRVGDKWLILGELAAL